MFPWEAKSKPDPKYVISLELSVTSVIPDTKTLVKPLWVTKRQAEKAKAKEDTKITQTNTQSACNITETASTESHEVVFLQLLRAYNLGNDLKKWGAWPIGAWELLSQLYLPPSWVKQTLSSWKKRGQLPRGSHSEAPDPKLHLKGTRIETLQ